MTLTDLLLLAIFVTLAVGLSRLERKLDELLATLNALAEMLGEEIDRRKGQDA
jgi:hypothetical protein